MLSNHPNKPHGRVFDTTMVLIQKKAARNPGKRQKPVNCKPGSRVEGSKRPIKTTQEGRVAIAAKKHIFFSYL